MARLTWAACGAAECAVQDSRAVRRREVLAIVRASARRQQARREPLPGARGVSAEGLDCWRRRRCDADAAATPEYHDETLVCPDAAAAVAGAADADAVRVAGLARDVDADAAVLAHGDEVPCVVAARDAVAAPSGDVVVWAWQAALSGRRQEASGVESRVRCGDLAVGCRAAAAADALHCRRRQQPSHRCRRSSQC